MKIDPTTGSEPPGRNSFAVSGKFLKRAWLDSVCERKVASTVNPSRAIRSAGFRTLPSRLLPQLSSAVCQVAGVPGVPTLSPLVTASAKASGRPFSRKSPESADSGAVSRPSIVCTVRDLAS